MSNNIKEYIPLKEAIKIANTSEDNIKQKLVEGVLKKYHSKTFAPLSDPIKSKGVFKTSEIIKAYSIIDIEKNIEEFNKKRKTADSILKDIVPSKIIQISSKDLDKIAELPDNSVDTFIITMPFDKEEVSKPMNYNDIINSNVPNLIEKLITHAKRILMKKGNLIVHSAQKYIPYIGNQINNFMFFKYWIVYNAKNLFINQNQVGLMNNGMGILYYIKNEKLFLINRVREPYTDCLYCGKPLKDYGGKKDQMHKDGATISDVWKTILDEIDFGSLNLKNDYDIPKPILSRLINLSCTDKSCLLLAPYDGDLDERYNR